MNGEQEKIIIRRSRRREDNQQHTGRSRNTGNDVAIMTLGHTGSDQWRKKQWQRQETQEHSKEGRERWYCELGQIDCAKHHTENTRTVEDSLRDLECRVHWYYERHLHQDTNQPKHQSQSNKRGWRKVSSMIRAARRITRGKNRLSSIDHVTRNVDNSEDLSSSHPLILSGVVRFQITLIIRRRNEWIIGQKETERQLQ